MNETAIKIAKAFDMLPESYQTLAYELLNTMLRNWDPDFVKLTSQEAEELQAAMNDPETISWDEIVKELNLDL